MKWTVLISMILVSTLAVGEADARSRSSRCREWAREQGPRPAEAPCAARPSARSAVRSWAGPDWAQRRAQASVPRMLPAGEIDPSITTTTAACGIIGAELIEALRRVGRRFAGF